MADSPLKLAQKQNTQVAKPRPAPPRNVTLVTKPEPAPAPSKPDVFEKAKALKPIDQALLPTVRSADASGSISPIDPLDVLKLVTNGDVLITVPIPAGSLPGGLTVQPNTVATVKAQVRDGNLIFSQTEVDLNPPIKGPFWADFYDVYIDENGQMKANLKPAFPDPTIGDPLKPDLPELADQFRAEEGTDIPIKVWGITISHVHVPTEAEIEQQILNYGSGSTGNAPAKLPLSLGLITKALTMASVAAPGSAKVLSVVGSKGPSAASDAPEATISITNVQLAAGTVPLTGGGSLTMGPGGTLEIVGTSHDLKITGHGNIADLSLDSGGLRVDHASGSGDALIHFSRGSDGSLSAQTLLSNFSARTNLLSYETDPDNYLALGPGEFKNATLQAVEAFVPSSGAASTQVSEVDIPDFQMHFIGAQRTLQEGTNTAYFDLGESDLSGSLHASPQQMTAQGSLKVDLNGAVKNFEFGTFKSAIAINRLLVHATAGKLDFDTQKGIQVTNSEIDVNADIALLMERQGQKSISLAVKDGSTTTFKTPALTATATGGFHASGVGSVDAQLANIQLGDTGLKLTADSAHLTGTNVPVTLDSSTGLSLPQGGLALDASLSTGELKVNGPQLKMDLKFESGTDLHAALKQATLAPDGTASFQLQPNAIVRAALAGGSVTLPDGQVVNIDEGGSIELTFTQLDSSNGELTAQGSLIVDLPTHEPTVNVDTTSIPGVQVVPLTNVSTKWRLALGTFKLDPVAGTFHADNVSFGVIGSVDSLDATLKPGGQ